MSVPRTTRQILLYGNNAALLNTRRMVLEQAGFPVDIVSTHDDFRLHLQRNEISYSLVIVCHTVPKETQQSLQTEISSAPLYQLTPLVAPTDFVRQVHLLMQALGRDPMPRPATIGESCS
jgi:hypothetical protein